MSRIEVAHGADHRLKQASQTVYKQFLAGRPLLIFCSDLKRLNAFSQYLWGVNPTAFVPHSPYYSIQSEAKSIPTLIKVASEIPENILDYFLEDTKPWLLNLDVACPPCFEVFDKVLEIVSNHPEDKQLAKQRIQHYKQSGHEVRFHQL